MLCLPSYIFDPFTHRLNLREEGWKSHFHKKNKGQEDYPTLENLETVCAVIAFMRFHDTVLCTACMLSMIYLQTDSTTTQTIVKFTRTHVDTLPQAPPPPLVPAPPNGARTRE